MADDFRTRTRNFLGLNPPKGKPAPTERSAYARFSSPGPDTTKKELLLGVLLYVLLTIFCIALVLGSTTSFGRVVFAVLGVLGFAFAMQRIVMVLNRSGDEPEPPTSAGPEPDDSDRQPGSSRRTGGSGRSKKAGGARRSGDPRRSS